jgi:ABC-type dipeptide/oligopeptide/nickel transport system permease component
MDADQNTAAAILILLAAAVTAVNLITDVVIGILDPRIRAGRFA